MEAKAKLAAEAASQAEAEKTAAAKLREEVPFANLRFEKNVILEQCKGVHCVDLDESFQTHIYLQNLASIQPRTRPANGTSLLRR